MDPFHVVRLAGDALDACRRRVQQDLHGHRGRTDDPLYRARRTLHTGHDFLTDKQTARLEALFTVEEHVEVEATWGIYQRIIGAYRYPDRPAGGQLMRKVIDDLTRDVPTELTERRPARHLQRADGGHQRAAGTPARLRPRLPQPDQLYRHIATRSRRLQTPPTPPNPMSRLAVCSVYSRSRTRSFSKMTS